MNWCQNFRDGILRNKDWNLEKEMSSHLCRSLADGFLKVQTRTRFQAEEPKEEAGGRHHKGAGQAQR